MDDVDGNEDILAAQRALEGDSAAFAGIVERHAGALRRFCLARLGDPEDAEDAVQDVFLRAFRSLRTFRLGSSFRAWIFGIAVNRIKSRYAAKEREAGLRARISAEVGALLAANSSADAESEAVHALEAWAARTAISLVGPANRAVAELYYVAGLRVEEIAESLGLGAEAVKSRLFRARKEIMKIMDAGATDGGREG